jgi:hypothetical protein
MSPVVSLNRFWRDEIIERMTRDTERRGALAVRAVEAPGVGASGVEVQVAT